MSSKLEERLDFWSCFFLTSKLHNTFIPQNDTHFTEFNYTCKSHGKYLAGTEESGRTIYIFLSVLIFLVGVFGVATNILNVIILRKTFSARKHFQESLVMLSTVELITCITAMLLTFFTISIKENLDRGKATLILFTISRNIFHITRTLSVYLSILITIERYVVVSFPIKCNNLFRKQTWRSRLILMSMLVFSILLHFPRMLKSNVAINPYRGYFASMETSELKDYPYLFVRNEFAERLNRGFTTTLLSLDFIAPFPLLLVANGLLYKSIYSWNKARIILSGRMKRDINAAKMFCVVVAILLTFHLVSIVVFITSRIQNETYIELFVLQRLAVVVAAGVNFWIYFGFSPGFQREFWMYLNECTGDKHEWIKIRLEKSGRNHPTLCQRTIVKDQSVTIT